MEPVEVVDALRVVNGQPAEQRLAVVRGRRKPLDAAGDAGVGSPGDQQGPIRQGDSVNLGDEGHEMVLVVLLVRRLGLDRLAAR